MDGNASVRTQDRNKKTAEVERLHEKTFRAWANSRLKKREIVIEQNLGEAFVTGIQLIQLMEVLTGDTCTAKYQKNPTKDIHKLENITIATDFIKKYVKINIASKDVMDGNMKVILGLIWRLILTFQVDTGDDADKENMSAAQRNRAAKQKLLKWCQDTTEGYNNVNITDFGESWYDGMGFCALVHAIDPNVIDFDSLDPKNIKENLEKAFTVAEEQLDIPRLLDAEDILAEDPNSRPDEQCFMTYLSGFPVALLQQKGAASTRRKEDDEAAKKAEEEARRKAEEEAARRIKEAEEAARRKAEEEAARREAELKAKMEADEEARRKKELADIEEAKRQAKTEALAKAEKKARKEEERRRIEEEERKRLADMGDAKRKAEEEARDRAFEEERRRLEEENRKLKEALLANKNHQLIGKLYVTLVEARNLRKKFDTYATLFLERQKEKSKPVKKSKTPKWGDEFEFYVSDPEANLEVTLLDRNWLFSDDFVGYVSISVSELEDGVEVSKWFTLQSSKGKGKKKTKKNEKSRGELRLSVTYRKDTLDTPKDKKEDSPKGKKEDTPKGKKEDSPKVEEEEEESENGNEDEEETSEEEEEETSEEDDDDDDSSE